MFLNIKKKLKTKQFYKKISFLRLLPALINDISETAEPIFDFFILQKLNFVSLICIQIFYTVLSENAKNWFSDLAIIKLTILQNFEVVAKREAGFGLRDRKLYRNNWFHFITCTIFKLWKIVYRFQKHKFFCGVIFRIKMPEQRQYQGRIEVVWWLTHWRIHDKLICEKKFVFVILFFRGSMALLTL